MIINDMTLDTHGVWTSIDKVYNSTWIDQWRKSAIMDKPLAHTGDVCPNGRRHVCEKPSDSYVFGSMAQYILKCPRYGKAMWLEDPWDMRGLASKVWSQIRGPSEYWSSAIRPTRT